MKGIEGESHGESSLSSPFSCLSLNKKHFLMTLDFSCPDQCWFISFIYLSNYIDKCQSLNILLHIYKYIIHTQSSTVTAAQWTKGNGLPLVTVRLNHKSMCVSKGGKWGAATWQVELVASQTRSCLLSSRLCCSWNFRLWCVLALRSNPVIPLGLQLYS